MYIIMCIAMCVWPVEGAALKTCYWLQYVFMYIIVFISSMVEQTTGNLQGISARLFLT